MQSFRTELENPIVEKDILELEKKIRLFREGKMDEEKFRSLRLARGVYGQRQQGVQMVRIKLPYGKMTLAQWKRISDVSDEYSTGNLHLTTRQDIQIHFVSLDRTPETWSELEKDDVTIREACGNTVRNITASDMAGIDPDEPFDVTPYAHAMFEYFLRKPVCQEMGRKFKIAFSSSEKDTALVISSSGCNIVPIEMAELFQQRGIKVVAIVTKAHLEKSKSKRSDGKKLSDFADLVLDSGAPIGDSMITIENLQTPVSPGSTVGGVIIINSIKAEVARLLTEAGQPPKVLTASAIVGDEKAKQLFESAYDEHAHRLAELYKNVGK